MSGITFPIGSNLNPQLTSYYAETHKILLWYRRAFRPASPWIDLDPAIAIPLYNRARARILWGLRVDRAEALAGIRAARAEFRSWGALRPGGALHAFCSHAAGRWNAKRHHAEGRMGLDRTSQRPLADVAVYHRHRGHARGDSAGHSPEVSPGRGSAGSTPTRPVQHQSELSL